MWSAKNLEGINEKTIKPPGWKRRNLPMTIQIPHEIRRAASLNWGVGIPYASSIMGRSGETGRESTKTQRDNCAGDLKGQGCRSNTLRPLQIVLSW